MAASAETGGQLRDGYFRRLGSQGNTDAGIVLRFFQISGQPDSLHGTQKVNQAFRIFRTASIRAFASFVRQNVQILPSGVSFIPFSASRINCIFTHGFSW